MDCKKLIRFGENSKGDISPILENVEAFQQIVAEMSAPFQKENIDKVVAIEARGFIFGAVIAQNLALPLVMVRKEGNLPMEVLKEEAVDYTGKKKVLEIQKDAIKKRERVLVVDDWAETGSQARATFRMIEKLGGKIAGFTVLVDNTTKEAKDFLSQYHYHYLIHFD